MVGSQTKLLMVSNTCGIEKQAEIPRLAASDIFRVDTGLLSRSPVSDGWSHSNGTGISRELRAWSCSQTKALFLVNFVFGPVLMTKVSPVSFGFGPVLMTRGVYCENRQCVFLLSCGDRVGKGYLFICCVVRTCPIKCFVCAYYKRE